MDTGLFAAARILYCAAPKMRRKCCVTTTVRECSDRGYECCILSDCTAGFDSKLVTASLDIICSYDGLFGYVGHSSDLIACSKVTEGLTPPKTPPVQDSYLPPIAELQRKYRSGLADPEILINSLLDHIEQYKSVDPAVWISIRSRKDTIAYVKSLKAKFAGKSALPTLYAIPFAVKDNIDVEGMKTTAACEQFAYIAKATAPVVLHLLAAGAVLIGKLNMDQLATGISGCRSPHGTPHSFYSQAHIRGGSSSGTGVAVAAALVSFALGTDTAGSGRVPAALNGIIGFKPTKGTISARGIVPACRSLDTVSIMAPSLADAREVWYVVDQYDDLDPFSKSPASLPTWNCDFRGPRDGGFKFGVPPTSVVAGFCSQEYRRQFEITVEVLKSCGGSSLVIDWTPFEGGSNLMYNATAINERIACIGFDFISNNMSFLHPITRSLFQDFIKADIKAWEVFQDKLLQAQYIRAAQKIFENIDVLLVPTTLCHPTIAEMEAEPMRLNAKVGVFTHFGNVLDLCAVTVNAGWVGGVDGPILPFGVSFIGQSGMDGRILDIAGALEDAVSRRFKL